MISTVRVRLAVWVGEMQLSERTGGVMVTISVVRLMAAIWVGEMQFGGRISGRWG